MLHHRILLFVLACSAALCLISLRDTQSQSALRRITNTTDEGININPSISGDGRIIGFESTEDIAGAGGTDHFRGIRGNISVDPPTFFQMGATRSAAPAISQDGLRIAFASKDDPLGTNSDGNSEILLFNGSSLLQITNTSPGDPANRVINGNFQPSISDDGRYLAFSSNRNLTSQNSDGNLEIFVYDAIAATFTQLTNSSGIVGFSDAKISGDGANIACIRDTGSTSSTNRDLVKLNRATSALTLLATNVQKLALTYGRAISDDGARVVYSGETATNSSQVFFYDGRSGNVNRQVTSLGTRSTEVPLHLTISGDGKRIAFATRRAVTGFSNSDASVELYTYDIPTTTFARVTSAPGEADCFDGSNAACEVVSSLNDDGSIVVFNFPRALSAPVASGLENKSEIYATGTVVRPPFGTLSAILNQASLGREPSPVKAVAPNSIAVALGSALANTTQQSQRQADGTFPTNVGGTTVTVNGRSAQIFFVSPDRVHFLVPPQTEIGGNAEVVITNADGFSSRGSVPTLRAAPGVFTETGDGIGEGVILNSDNSQSGPFDPSSGNLHLSIFSTGVRNALQTTVNIAGRVVTPEAIIPSSEMPGLDEVRVRVPSDLRGTGTVTLSIQTDGRDSNPVTVTFTGDPSRNVVINEVLADPPDGIAGDANHDGVRDGTQDEFVELVNGSSSELINISGWTIRTRATGSMTENTRFTFASGTSLPAGEAIVVFGGGNFNPSDPVFGCAQVVKTTTSSGLSLTNSGLTILVRDGTGNLISQFSYGGSTALEGDNNQSLTRSPDVTGAFVQHTAAAGANGRAYSPGLRVDGTPFGNCPGHVTTVTIAPTSTSVAVNQLTQFSSQAFDEYGRVMTSVTINFSSDNTAVATVDSVSMNGSTGVATANVTGRSQGTAHIQASVTSGGTTVKSPQATLSVVPRVTRIDVTPTSATINRGNTQQFSATAFDQNNQPLSGVTFTWSSSDTNVATIDSSGLARGVGLGSVTITASAPDGTGGIATGTAMLAVQVPIVINEINADVAPDNASTTAIEGDANRDGIRDSGDDEFVELLNNSNASVDLSGVVIADSTSNRFTFPANTTLASGRAVVIFGGGNPPVNDPAFGGSLILTASSLSLNDTGDTVNVKLAVGGSDVVIATQAYGGASGVVALSDQSLTRSPDAAIGNAGGSFVAHNAATNAAGRIFSSGTRADGTPFGSPPITRIEVVPASARVNIGATQSFTGHAFSNTGGPEIEIQNVSFIWDSSDTTKATVAPTTGQTTTASTTNSGDSTIRARAGGQQGTSVLSVNPTISINDPTMNEGDTGTTTLTFTVSLSTPAPSGGVTFDIATQDGTATVANNDYQARSLTAQIIPAGGQTYMFDVTVNGDTTIEPNETFFVNLTNISGATLGDGQGQGTILNDDSATLSVVNPPATAEGDTGTKTFTFTVHSSLPAPMGGITFDIATQDNTATAGSDYVARSLTNQTIPEGQQDYSFDVTVNGDTLVEPNETFFVNVTSASNGSPQGTGTINNDDAANVVISQVYGGGNNSGAPFQNDFVQIFNRGTTTIDFAITPYSVQYASVGSNFGSSKTNLTAGIIAPGKYFLVQESGGTTNGAPLPTPDATGTIALAATSGKVALVVGTTALSASTCPGDDSSAPFNPSDATIADFVGYGSTAGTAGHCYEGSGPAAAPSNTTADFRKAGGCTDTNQNAGDFLVSTPFPRNSSSPANDCAGGATPALSINDVSVAEGNSGPTTATFTVSLTSAPQGTDVTFDIATQDGTATTANNDYVAKSLTGQVIPAGQTTYTFSVTVNGDTTIEPDETFSVNVTNVASASVADGQGLGTITNNDQPTLSISNVTMVEGNSGQTAFNFTASLTGGTAPVGGVNFTINTADGTINPATAGSDYVAIVNGSGTISQGNTSTTVTVMVNGDMTNESDESFFVNLSNISGANPGDTQGLGTITNDDTPTLSINNVTVTEGNSGTTAAMFTVTLSPASNQTVTVDYATANGTAIGTMTGGTDYQSTSGTLTFNPLETSKPINVLVNGDTTNEAICETFFVNLSNAMNANISGSAGSGQGGITDDDGTKVVISQVYGGGNNSGAPYRNDFIEIFNRGNTAVSLNGWSVQYASDTGTTWSVTNLTNISLQPGQYYLVQEAGGTTNGVPLPTPDATGTIAMAAGAGKVALVNSTTALSGSCPSSATIIDLVGYGTTASCFEGAGRAPAPSNTLSDQRASSGCIDTGNNNTDFAAAAPNPRNTSSPTNTCSCSTSYSSLLLFADIRTQTLAKLFIDRPRAYCAAP